MSKPILFSYFRSSAAHRVRIALNLKKIAYEYRSVHLLNAGGEQHSKEYRSLNPSREVPTLLIDGFTLAQSIAIIEYLDETQPSPALFPKSSGERAQVRRFCEIINSGIQPLGNLRVLQELERQFGANQEQKSAWTQHWIHLGLEAIDELLSKTAKTYSFGDQVSAADCFLVPQVFSAIRFGADHKPYRNVTRVFDTCMLMPEFVAAAPQNQPDAQTAT